VLILSFNCNSIRPRLHQLRAIIDRYQPDVIGLQETKVVDQDFPVDAIAEMGYQAEFHGQKTHYGVALLVKGLQSVNVRKGFDTDGTDSQRRFISMQFTSPSGEDVTVINGYFPQGESRDHPVKFPNKRAFYVDLLSHLNKYHKADQNIVVIGDMNVAPEDQDIGIGEDNRKRWLKTGKASFLPEEREWLQQLTNWGLHDSYRKHFPDNREKFSWFDYRTRGFELEPKRGIRIDFILATKPLLDRCTAAGIDYDIRAMEKSSDHCPVWAKF
jgi:exodeoxyribonuclease-3